MFRPHAVQNMGVVPVVFGVIGMGLAYGQMKTFVVKPKERMFWLNTHMGNFMGSYIAAWSAFSAVTLTRLLGNQWYVWLWPTIVGIPASALISGYYRRKFAPKERVEAASAA